MCRCYKTHVLGRPTIVVDDPEEVHRLLANDLRLFTVNVRLSAAATPAQAQMAWPLRS